MKRLQIIFALIFIYSILIPSFSQTIERKDIPEKYKWNLADIYKNIDEWKAHKEKLMKDIEKFSSFKGKLAENPEIFYNALKSYFDILKGYYKLSSYASMLSDEDLGNTDNQAFRQEADNLGTKFDESSSFLNPEILKIAPAKIKQFFDEKKELAEFKMFVDDIQRMRAHTLSESGEKILASFGLIVGSPADVYNIFNNSERPFPKVTLSTGEEVELTSSNYVKYRTTPVREDRAKIFEAMFGSYGDFKNMIGANYLGKVKTDYVYAKDRKYKSALERSLDRVNVPVSVYENLITQIHNSLPTLYRFLDLKKRMLGVDTLHYYDLYTPIVKKVEMNFTVEEGQKVILDALKPLGKDYLNTVQKAFKDRWIDYMPNSGKRSGAYSNGATYDEHPFILMSWTDDYESVSTLAHEMGHTMHSYYSNTNQPFATSDYPIFVAEIASTTNETLLNNYMVKQAKTDEEKLYLLGSYLELLRTTIFRQTQFAEFEWEIHKLVEKGKPVTGEQMSKIYYDLVKKYYGSDEGHCVADPYIAYEWEYIPHFVNYTYYVYQYSTSIIYGTAFADKILNGGQPAVDKYFNILKGGNSDYPLNLIKKAGIDPLSSEAFDLTMKKMNGVMDQIEEILSRMNK
ncbi:oligoendopeptidase F, plasmid [bacterium BMS3Abin03]|nr:oligoendopeptidase F, plasmid [bacterium BMS3Abin03]HDZ58913.1 oligoendopeptidase F [Ignavibacteriales bacterium]